MTMSFKFGEVDAHGIKLGAVIQDMENSLVDLQKLQSQLEVVFRGAAGDIYQQTAGAFAKKLSMYNTALAQVKNAVLTTSGSEGLMQVTDQNNGKLFYTV